MDFSKALTFPFEDDQWIVKFIVGSLAMIAGLFLPVIPLGYSVQVARNVIRRRQEILPGTDELGQVVMDGLLAFVAGLIYMLPVLPFICLQMFTFGVVGDSDIGGFLSLCVGCCVGGFVLILGLPLAGMYTAGIMRYAQTGTFSSFLEARALWEDVRYNMSTFLMLLVYWLVFAAVMMIIAPLSVLACGVGFFVAMFYQQIVQGHLIGQAGRLMLEGKR